MLAKTDDRRVTFEAGNGGSGGEPVRLEPDLRGSCFQKEDGQDQKEMAERTGLEPATPGVTGRYSNQLNYRSTGVGG